MKVYIGPYKNWIGPYQLANYLRYIGLNKNKCDFIGGWLSNTFVNDICNLIYKLKHRKIKVKIDHYDTWSMDSTLAYIVLPMLKQLKDTKHGSPFIDDEDVPDNIKSTSATPKENEWDTDEFFFDRWDYVLDEMIFAFEMKNSEWEDKFHTGNADIVWEDISPNEYDEDKKLYTMKNGPNDTYKFDSDGYKKVQDRISNGFRLFGKYYEALWD